MAIDDPDDAYVMPHLDDVKKEAEELLGQWQNVAVYTLEQPVRCPHCREPIHTLHVVGLTRTQVAFTSRLPRTGRVFVCPACERLLSVELAGLI